MPMSKSHIAATQRYNDKAYQNINFRVYKGEKDTIKSHAESRGESLNGFINRAIAETMERDKAGEG